MHADGIGLFRGAMAFGLAVLAAGAAHSAVWKVTTGGAVDDMDNWDGDPTESSAEFKYTQTAPITQNAASVTLGAPSGTDFVFAQGDTYRFDGEIALGKGKTLVRNGSGSHYFRGPYICHLTSGTMSFPAGTCVFGDTAVNPGAFYVDGQDAAFEAVNMRFLASTAGILFAARDGGRISGRMYIDATGSGMTMLVTGTNSVFELPSTAAGAIYIGSHGSNNVFRIEDGGSYADRCGSKDFCVGRSVNRSYGMAYGGNRLEVSSGGTFSHAFYLYVGFDTSSNTFTVASGGTATIGKDLCMGYVRYLNSDGNYYPADGNRVVVTGEDSRLCVTGTCYVGRQYASGSSLVAEDGGTIELLGRVNVGTDFYCTNDQIIARSGGLIEVGAIVMLGSSDTGCTGHRILVDGGIYHQKPDCSLYMRKSPECTIEVVNGGFFNATNANIYVGDTSSGESLGHLVSVRSGGTLKCRQLQFGVKSSTNTVEVYDGTLVAEDGAYFGSGGGTGNALVLSGTNALFTAGTAKFSSDSTITFNVPPGGYASAPFVASEQEFAEGTKAIVNEHQDNPGGRSNRVVLMRTDGSSLDSTISNIVWQLPDGAKLDLAETNPQEIAITFGRHAGLCVIVK